MMKVTSHEIAKAMFASNYVIVVIVPILFIKLFISGAQTTEFICKYQVSVNDLLQTLSNLIGYKRVI